MERQVRVTNKLGLHVRPSTQFAQTASKFNSNVFVMKDGQMVNAKSSIELLTLAAVEGTVLTIKAEGTDAEAAVNALIELINNKFWED